MSIPDLLSDSVAGPAGRRRWLSEGDPADADAALIRGRGAEGAGKAGAIACGSPHAARAGMDALRRGGSAADAAAAAAFALMVADPPNASPAGRGHVLWAPAGDSPRAIDGASMAPKGLPEGLPGLPVSQALPVPGIVRAVLRLHRDGGRLPLADIAAPARDLAREGFEVPDELAAVWAWRAPEIADPDARAFYLPGGAAPYCGEIFRNPGLATFFDRLIAAECDPFADPEFAAPFCERIADKGAFWTLEDLQFADPKDGETVTLDGAGWRMTSIGRQGWGHVLLRIVALVEGAAPETGLEAECMHLLAILHAFAERREESHRPGSGTASRDLPAWPEHGARCEPAALAKALARAQPCAAAEERDTTHLSVVDSDGSRVALTQSIGPHFGSRVADPETGVLLAHSYRMAEAPARGARDVTEQCPCLLDMEGGSYAFGGAGSVRIPGAVAAVARHLLAGRELVEALAAPRANWIGATARIHLDAPVGLEDRLAAAGVDVEFAGRGPIDHLGIVHAAGRRSDGAVVAAADPAYSGIAVAS